MVFKNTLKVAKNIFFAGLLMSSASVFADTFIMPSGTNAPNVDYMLQWKTNPSYRAIYNVITPLEATIQANVAAFIAAPATGTYNTVYGAAQTLANNANTAFSITSGLTTNTSARVVITLQDGTVLVDTFKGNLNTYANYEISIGASMAYAVTALPADFFVGGFFPLGMNHNTRNSIAIAQEWPAGVGVETKYSTTSSLNLSYVAVRLGNFLNGVGTVRLSVPSTTFPPS